MNFVIPMAGRGSRFLSAGFNKPKWAITAHGKCLLEWSVDSLPLDLCKNLVFVALKEHERTFGVVEFVHELYGQKCNVKTLLLDKVTQGQMETVLQAKSLINLAEDLLIFNIDTYFHSETLRSSLLKNTSDGVLGAFTSTESRFSFARIDNETGNVLETAEKVPISTNALTGLYHFKEPEDFIVEAEKILAEKDLHKGEYYIAPLYNRLIRQGRIFTLDFCDSHWILGTPEELADFIENFANA